MEEQSGLSELSVISWASAIQGCPLSGVPLYYNIFCANMYILNNEGWNGHNSNIGRVPSTAAVFPHWIATAALCVRK